MSSRCQKISSYDTTSIYTTVLYIPVTKKQTNKQKTPRLTNQTNLRGLENLSKCCLSQCVPVIPVTPSVQSVCVCVSPLSHCRWLLLSMHKWVWLLRRKVSHLFIVIITTCTTDKDTTATLWPKTTQYIHRPGKSRQKKTTVPEKSSTWTVCVSPAERAPLETPASCFSTLRIHSRVNLS